MLQTEHFLFILPEVLLKSLTFTCYISPARQPRQLIWNRLLRLKVFTSEEEWLQAGGKGSLIKLTCASSLWLRCEYLHKTICEIANEKSKEQEVQVFGPTVWNSFCEISREKIQTLLPLFSLKSISEVKLSALLQQPEPSLWITHTAQDIGISKLDLHIL